MFITEATNGYVIDAVEEDDAKAKLLKYLHAQYGKSWGDAEYRRCLKDGFSDTDFEPVVEYSLDTEGG